MPPQGERRVEMRRLLAGAGSVVLVMAVAAGMLVTHGAQTASKPATVTGNFLVDQDHRLLFSQNKQNEPAITRDPQTGVLIAGANDEIGQPLCAGTTSPLASPCPFAPGVPTSAFYRSTDNGQSWTGGYLPGVATLGRPSRGDPRLDDRPHHCT